MLAKLLDYKKTEAGAFAALSGKIRKKYFIFNVKKDKAMALSFNDKILAIDPTNTQALANDKALKAAPQKVKVEENKTKIKTDTSKEKITPSKVKVKVK